MHLGRWAILLSIFWLLLSGYLQPLLLAFGVASVVIVLIVVKRMDQIDLEPISVDLGFKTLRYFFWLIGQIVLSATHVTKLVWGKSSDVSPAQARVSIKNIPSKHHVLYANSITLTPGTLSVDLESDHVTVHALQASSIQQLEEGGMEKKLTDTFGCDSGADNGSENGSDNSCNHKGENQ